MVKQREPPSHDAIVARLSVVGKQAAKNAEQFPFEPVTVRDQRGVVLVPHGIIQLEERSARVVSAHRTKLHVKAFCPRQLQIQVCKELMTDTVLALPAMPGGKAEQFVAAVAHKSWFPLEPLLAKPLEPGAWMDRVGPEKLLKCSQWQWGLPSFWQSERPFVPGEQLCQLFVLGLVQIRAAMKPQLLFQRRQLFLRLRRLL